jgi:hypothetical protein
MTGENRRRPESYLMGQGVCGKQATSVTLVTFHIFARKNPINAGVTTLPLLLTYEHGLS